MESCEVEIVYFTDPWCTWCWGSEPILRRIMEEYGGQVRISYVMGGLVEDIDSFYDPVNRISTVEQVAPHWLEASARHGMPVDVGIFYEDPPSSTYPANIAYHAAKLQDPAIADKFLRRMREAAATERRNLGRMEVLVELAGEMGLDRERFALDMEGEAKERFEEDLRYSRGLGVTGFPTFLLRNRRGDKLWLHGYQGFEIFERAFERLAPGLRRKKPEGILDFVRKYGRAATREVAEVFGLSMEEAQRKLEGLEKTGRLRRIRLGNGSFWEPGAR